MTKRRETKPKQRRVKPRKTTVHMPDDDNMVFELLQAHHGNMAHVARLLNVTRATVKLWVDRSAKRKARYKTIRQGCKDNLLDLAENALEDNLQSENGMISNRAAEIVMKHMGKKRGYVPASHVDQNVNDNVVVTVKRE